MCAVYDDELDSVGEDEGEKNLRCDTCPRWFHLGCTKVAGQAYDTVCNQIFFVIIEVTIIIF